MSFTLPGMEEYSLLGLFVSAFISSTLLPGGSEVVLLYLATQTDESLLLLWLIASLGNSLGGLTSWGLGWWLAKRFPDKTPDKISTGKSHQHALQQIRRWGSPVLLLSWLPIIGDPLCFVAGWLKLSLLYSVIFITAGKAARYGVILYYV